MTKNIKFVLESKNKNQDCWPVRIRLTKSINQETGTVILSFAPSFSVTELQNEEQPFYKCSIFSSNFSVSTKAIRIIWLKGKPLLIQAVFLVDNFSDLDKFVFSLKEYASENWLLEEKPKDV